MKKKWKMINYKKVLDNNRKVAKKSKRKNSNKYQKNNKTNQ